MILTVFVPIRDFPWDDPNEFLVFDTSESESRGYNEWYRFSYEVFDEMKG